MTKQIKLYLKTKRTFDSAELSDLKRRVLEKLPDGSGFDIFVGFELPDCIDWSRSRSEPIHPQSEARFLTQTIDGVEIYCGGNIGPGSNTKLIEVDTIINWIGRLKKELPPVIGEEERDLEHLFDVQNTWKRRRKQYVYKYCSWSTAKDYVLGGPKTLRMNNIGSMNDPLEFQNLTIPIYYPGGVSTPIYGMTGRDQFAGTRYRKAIERATKNGVRFFCCSQDVESDFNHSTGYMRQPAVRGFDHPAMWNHYADQHEGICLVLDKEKLHNVFKEATPVGGNLLCGPVTYAPKLEGLGFAKGLFSFDEGMLKWSQEEFDNHVRSRVRTGDHARTLFFQKTQEWANESEFRWVILGDGLDPIDIPVGDALVGVVVGSDFDDGHHTEIDSLAFDCGALVRRLWWDNGSARPPMPLSAFDDSDPGRTLTTEAAKRRKMRTRKQ